MSRSTGHFQISKLVRPEFFSKAAKLKQEEQMVQQEMPFLYGILMGMLKNGEDPSATGTDGEDSDSKTCTRPNEPINGPSDTFEAQLLERDGITYVPNYGGQDQVSCRWHHVSFRLPF
jgi:hypothetical protein